MSPVEFKKRPCRPVEFKGQGPYNCALIGQYLGHMTCYNISGDLVRYLQTSSIKLSIPNYHTVADCATAHTLDPGSRNPAPSFPHVFGHKLPIYHTIILEDSVTSHIFASLCLIRCGCYAHTDNRLRQRGQTNPRRGHAGACGSLVLLQLITCLCFSAVLENIPNQLTSQVAIIIYSYGHS